MKTNAVVEILGDEGEVATRTKALMEQFNRTVESDPELFPFALGVGEYRPVVYERRGSGLPPFSDSDFYFVVQQPAMRELVVGRYTHGDVVWVHNDQCVVDRMVMVGPHGPIYLAHRSGGPSYFSEWELMSEGVHRLLRGDMAIATCVRIGDHVVLENPCYQRDGSFTLRCTRVVGTIRSRENNDDALYLGSDGSIIRRAVRVVPPKRAREGSEPNFVVVMRYEGMDSVFLDANSKAVNNDKRYAQRYFFGNVVDSK